MRESILPPEYRASHVKALVFHQDRAGRYMAQTLSSEESGLSFDWDAVYSGVFGRFYLEHLYELIGYPSEGIKSMGSKLYRRSVDSLLVVLLAEAWGIDLEGFPEPLDTPQGP